MPPQSSPRRGEEGKSEKLSPRGEKIIRIPLSLEGKGQGEGEIEVYTAAHFVK